MSETVRGVEAVLAFVALLVAGGFACRGWLANQPESARRYGWRLATFITLLVYLTLAFWCEDQHRWYDWVWYLVAFVFLSNYIERNWKRREAARKVEARFTRIGSGR